MQYGVKGRDAKLRWYIFGFPKPDFSFTFNNTTIETTDRFSCSYNNAGELTLVINRLVGRVKTAVGRGDPKDGAKTTHDVYVLCIAWSLDELAFSGDALRFIRLHSITTKAMSKTWHC